MALTRTTSAAWRRSKKRAPRTRRRPGTGELNITRMDYARTHGWWVRLYRTEQGRKVCHSRHFSDGKLGGRREALLAARAWRDQKTKRLPKAQKNAGRAVVAGHGYVKRVEMKRRVGTWPVWIAWLRIEDRRCKQTSYSCEKWGERGAKRRAEQWLEQERAALWTRLGASPRAA